MARHQSDLKRRELALRAIIQEAIGAWPQLDLDPSMASESDLYISGADMLEWFSGWRQRAIDVLYDRQRTAPNITATEVIERWRQAAPLSCTVSDEQVNAMISALNRAGLLP